MDYFPCKKPGLRLTLIQTYFWFSRRLLSSLSSAISALNSHMLRQRRQPHYATGSAMPLEVLPGVSSPYTFSVKGETRNPRDHRWLRLGWEPFRIAQVVLSVPYEVEKWNRGFTGVRIQKIRSILN